MNIFENDNEVLQIGALTIENTEDGILISGDVHIEKTQAGKKQAQALYDFAQALMTAFYQLERQKELDKPCQTQNTHPVMRDNPFD